ncbi:phosphoglucomutase [Clostridia bacterium]|nr:phosphoglucomutase [Clostridia bacterium]
MINTLYNEWIIHATEDTDLIPELKNMDENSKNDAFYRDLEFGTGGLRGVLGAGTNRMNIYTIRRATQGIVEYIKDLKIENPSVAVSFDSRNKSSLFANEVAKVFANSGIKVYIYKGLMPTPMLSFAVRETKSTVGIMVTASHNPAKYNGYKTYGADGCQMTDDASEKVLEKINALPMFSDVKYEKNAETEYISDELINKFFAKVKEQSIHCNTLKDAGLKAVYTPLNGTGNKPVRRILDEIGIKDVVVVKEQENPDGNFTTCPFPNPEIKEALQLGLDYCEKEKPDILLATDPDCDRVGIAIPSDDGDYVLFDGNTVGALLTEYVLSERKRVGSLPENPIVIKTIVSTDMIFDIAKNYNAEVAECLTGFKYIGEIIGRLEAKGEEDRFVFGFEESYGYLAGTHARDKDAVVASMLICEMAAYYKSKGLNLLDVRETLYKRYGFYVNTQDSFYFEGEKGMHIMQTIMAKLRAEQTLKIGSASVTKFVDYKNDDTGLPKSNVLSYILDNGTKVIIRPSGTEPKLKAYFFAKGKTLDEAKELNKTLANEVKALLGI